MKLCNLIQIIFLALTAVACQVKSGANEAGGLFEGHQNVPVSVSLDLPAPINIANSSAYTLSGNCSTNDAEVTLVIGALTFSETCTEKRFEFNSLDLSSEADTPTLSLNVTHLTKFVTRSVRKDTVSPTLVSTFISPGARAAGQTIFVQVSFDEEVTYLLSPRIEMSFNSMALSPPYASVVSGAGFSTLHFSYVALPGDSDANGIDLVSSIDLNGGAITDLAGNPAPLILTSTNFPAVTIAGSGGAPSVAITSPLNGTFINIAGNGATFPVSGTCDEASATVAVIVNGAPAISPSGFVCDGSNFSGTIDVSALSEGAVSIIAELSNGSGTGSSAAVNLTKDITPPTVALASPANVTAGNGTGYALSGSCSEDGSTVSVSLGTLSSSPPCSGGSWNISAWDVSALADGPAISLTINHTDLAGNPASQVSATVSKDTSAPGVSISSPVDNGYINIATNSASFPISGACSEAGATVVIKVDGAASASPSGLLCDGANFTGTIDVTALSESTHALVAELSDGANTGTSSPVNVIKDVSAPSVALGALSPINSTNVTAYSVSGTCTENGRSVSVSVGALANSATCLGGTFSLSNWDVSAVPDSGSVAVTADHSDLAGNPATQATATIVKDLTGPTLAITAPLTGAYVNIAANTSAFGVSGTCSENGRTVAIEIDGAPAPSPSGFVCDGVNFSGSIDVTSLAETDLDIVATITDLGGNAASSAVVTVTKDITAPVLALDSVADITTANQSSFTVSGTCGSEASSIALSLGALSATPGCSGGTFASTFDATGIPDGTVTVTAEATDLAGNTGTSSTSVTKDTTAPVLSITFSPDISTGNQATYQFLGTCSENGVTVSASLGGLTFSPVCSGGSWSVGPTDVSAAPDSLTLPMSVSQTDAYGYSGSASTTVVKNTSSISVAISSAPDITKTNNTSYQISGSCSQNGVVVSLSIGGIARSPFCSGGSWSTGFVDVSGLSDGPVTITADHSTALQASVTVTKDTLSPTVTISSAPNMNVGNQASYKVTGTCSQNSSAVTVWIESLNFNRTCTNGAWSTGFVDVSSIPDGASILITADHSSAPQASRTVSKATSTPSVANLTVPTTLDTSVNLDWDLIDPGGFTINDYVIEYRLKGQTTWLTASDGVSTNTYGTASGLSPGTTYELRVAVVYNTSSQSGWSSIAEGETKPNSPIIGANVAMNVGGAVDSTVVAYEDGTNITLNGSPLITLNRGQTHRFTSAQFDVIDADKPIFTAGRKGSGGATTAGNIVWQPTAWAGKIFSFNADRESFQRVDVYALENTTVEVYKGTTLLDSVTLTAGASGTLNWSPLGSYQLQATGTILAYHISTDNASRIVDPKPLLPNALEIIGFPSKDMNLSTDTNATNYTAIHSNSTTINNTIDKNQVVTLGPQGTSSLYQTESLLISADQKIFGASYADSNGNCSAPFLPTNLMKRKFAIPVSGDYIAFASKTPGTIEVRNAADGLVTTLTLTRSGASPSAPYKARLASPSAGHRYISTVPVAAWYQPNTDVGAANQDETIMYGSN